MKTRGLISVLSLLLLVTTSLQAGVVPGRWEKLDAQPVGTRILVTLDGGDRLECDFKGSGTDAVTVIDQSGVERTLPKSAIRKILSARRRVNDSVIRGGLIGAAVAVLAILPFAVILSVTDPLETSFFELSPSSYSKSSPPQAGR